jgi:hypothetical protein
MRLPEASGSKVDRLSYQARGVESPLEAVEVDD